MSDQLLSNAAVINIKIDGTDLSDLERDLEEVVVDTTYNLPSMATIRLHDPELAWVDDTHFDIGKTLTITMGAPAVYGGQKGEVFIGEIVAIEPDFSGKRHHTLTICAYDRSHRLHLGRNTQTYLDQSDSQIVQEIAQAANLRANVDNTTPKYEYVLQYNQTDMEFLTERARRIGYQLFVLDQTIYFKDHTYVVAGPSLTLSDELRSFHVRMSAAHQSTDYAVYSWDHSKKQAIVGKAQAKAAWRQNGISKSGGSTASIFSKSTRTAIDPQVLDVAEARKIAAAMAADLEGDFIDAEGVCFGNPNIKAGVQVDLAGLGQRFSGKYFVTTATHIFSRGSYETHITVAGRYPQTMNRLLHNQGTNGESTGREYGVVVGVVTNVGNDPEKIGRVKVKYPWLPQDSKQVEIESTWARIAVPSAGAGRGIYFLPEVNDEVLVAFEQGDVNRPFIVGALWNGKDKPPEDNKKAYSANEGVIHRIIHSRTGHRIVLDDSKNAQSILVEDGSGTQSIFIDTTKKSISIKADGDLNIDVKGNINISAGKDINIKAMANINEEANSNYDLKANANAKIEAANLTLKGLATATLESPTTSVKGNGTLQVEAGGPATVKGNPIMLN